MEKGPLPYSWSPASLSEVTQWCRLHWSWEKRDLLRHVLPRSGNDASDRNKSGVTSYARLAILRKRIPVRLAWSRVRERGSCAENKARCLWPIIALWQWGTLQCCLEHAQWDRECIRTDATQSVHVLRPYGRILGFLGRSCCFSF
jgi:hypothetical protein